MVLLFQHVQFLIYIFERIFLKIFFKNISINLNRNCWSVTCLSMSDLPMCVGWLVLVPSSHIKLFCEKFGLILQVENRETRFGLMIHLSLYSKRLARDQILLPLSLCATSFENMSYISRCMPKKCFESKPERETQSKR